MPENHSFRINGVRWLWRYARLKGRAIGWAQWPDNRSPNLEKKVLIDERLTGRARLDTEIHEYLHAANPTLSEEHVAQQGTELSRILWALGYRRMEEA
jgi:hypothetical protein